MDSSQHKRPNIYRLAGSLHTQCKYALYSCLFLLQRMFTCSRDLHRYTANSLVETVSPDVMPQYGVQSVRFIEGFVI